MPNNGSVARSPAPKHVRDKRWLRTSIFALLIIGLAVKMEMYVRSATDWTAVQEDSIFWQAVDGLTMQYEALNTANGILKAIAADDLLAGKRVLVTGGNRGLGRETATQLAALGAHVMLTTRSQTRNLVDDMYKEVARHTVRSSAQGSLTVEQLDLSDLNSVDSFMDNIQSETDAIPFDVAVLNAGVAPQQNQTTAQGFELALGVNCIGHYYLIKELIAKNLVKDRVVVVTSETFRASAPLNINTLFQPVQFGLSHALRYYARSKLAVNTMTNELARKYSERLHVHLICPGPVATNLANQAPEWLKPIINVIMELLFQSPNSAARPVIALIGAPEFGQTTGRYFHMHKEKPQRGDATDPELAQVIWNKVNEEIQRRHGRK